MNVDLKITFSASGAARTYTVRDSQDWGVLVNRVITKHLGAAAARDRQDVRESEWPERSWSGLVDGGNYSITEVALLPALAEVELAAGQVEIAAKALKAAQVARDEAVRSALAQGRTVAELGPVSRLSRERLYQVRDNRR